MALNVDDVDVLIQMGIDPKQVQQIKAQLNQTATEIEKIGDAATVALAKKTTAATDKAIAAQKKLEAQTQDNIRAVQRYNDEFDRVSRDVGLAGDIGSNANIVAGLLQTGGQTELAGAVQVLGELSEGVEGIARLKASIAGFPATVGAALQALGPAGIAATAALAVAAVAFGELQKSIESNQNIVQSNAAAYKEVNDLINSGITTPELQKERDERAQSLEDERENLARLNSQRAAIEAELAKNPVLSIASQLRGDLNVFNDLTSESQANIDRLNKSLEFIDGAFGDVELAANDAAAALERTANQIDNKLLNELNILTQASDQTAEQIQEQIDSIIKRKALIAQLLNSQQLSADATKRLNEEMILLNGEMILLTDSVLPAAQAMDALNAANEDTKRQQDETIAATRKFNEGIAALAQASAQERLKIEDDYAKKIIDLTRKYNEDIEDANLELGRDLADLIRGAGRDTDDAERQARQDRLQEIIQFNNETAKQARDLQRELIDIREDSADQEEELIRNRDFAGLRNLRRERNRALDDAVDSFNDEQREREIAFREQQDLTNQQLKFEAETRRIRFEQQVADARIAYNRDLDDLKRNRRRQEQVLADSRLRELTLVASTQNNKLSLLAQSYETELRLAAQNAQQRIAIQRQVDQALLAQANAFRAGFNLTGGNAGGNTITQTFQQTFSGGGSVKQNAALAGVIAVEVGRQIKNLLG